MFLLTHVKFQLKVYAKQQATRSFENNIGFTTPREMVYISTTIKLTGQDVIIANLYSFIMCFLYAASVYSFLNHYYPSHEDEISTRIRDNSELVGGLTVTAILTVAMEIITRFINCGIWSASVKSSSGVFVAVWLPQGYIFFMGTCLNLYYHVKYLRRAPVETVNDEIRWWQLDTLSRYYDAVVTRFAASINVHIILPLMLTAFGLAYTAFPAFVLMVAFPTLVIVMIPTALAFLFATGIFSAIMIKLYKQSVTSPRLEKRKETIMFTLWRFLPFYIAVLFLKSVIVILLYLLIVGRGSVTNSGPLFILMLSILPPFLVSSISWIAKKTILDSD